MKFFYPNEFFNSSNKYLIFISNFSFFFYFHLDTKRKQEGITIAGGNGQGNQLNQLYGPRGIFIDDDQTIWVTPDSSPFSSPNYCYFRKTLQGPQGEGEGERGRIRGNPTIYIADCYNDRIVEWKCNATKGQIVAGGNGYGNKTNQLNWPRDVIIDKENNSLIISDRGNRRVMRWFRQNNTKNGEIIIKDIDCCRLTMDQNGSLYVSDSVKNEVRRWKRGDQNGTIIAGGNGEGNDLNQLNLPAYIFVDEDYSLYVSDVNNHRVMKWLKDAKEGIVVAGGNGQGNSLTQLSSPRGVIVDQLGQIYVADYENDRVMRWCKGDKQGTIVVGGNGKGGQSDQLYGPTGLSFDRQGNLYVADYWNDRIQKFELN
jgi:sugar lactone lactonase YvrE